MPDAFKAAIDCRQYLISQGVLHQDGRWSSIRPNARLIQL